MRALPRLARILAVTTVAAALAGSIIPAHAQAAEQPVQLSAKVVDQPGEFFDLTLEPGQTRQLEIALGNHGKTAIAVRTYAADAYTIINGGFGAALRDTAVAGTTTWLDYPAQTLTLEPDRATVQPLSVTVPLGTAPGEYIASVILENDAPVKGSGSVALDQVVRQAVAVAIRVPGALVPGLAIGAASHGVVAGRSVVAVDVTNTGNSRLTPAAKIAVKDSTGVAVSSTTVPMDSFYAGTATKVEITLATTLAPGEYTVDLALDDDGRDAHASGAGLPLSVVEVVEQAADAPTEVGQQVVDVLQKSSGQLPLWAVAAIALALLLAGLLAVRHHLSHRRQPRHSRRRGPAARPAAQDRAAAELLTVE